MYTEIIEMSKIELNILSIFFEKPHISKGAPTVVFYSDLDSADFQSSKFIAKLSINVANSALLYKIVLEVKYGRRSFEIINQSAIDIGAIL